MLFAIVIVCVAACIGCWFIGERRNNQGLRVIGILLMLVMLVVTTIVTWEVGLIFGHGRAYTAARTSTAEFLHVVDVALEAGRTESVIAELHRLQNDAKSHEKRAGSFFVFEMEDSKRRLNAAK